MLTLTGVSCRFGDVAAVNGIDLEVARGEWVVFLGGSGAGKTTALKLINRLIPPTGGTIALDGEDVAQLDGPTLRRRIGYVFQGVGLFPHMTVAQNVGITCKLLGWDAAKIEARVDELLDMVELAPRSFRNRFPEQLSGGQAQRIGVARALAARPELVLFDEPFGALDPLTRRRIQRSMQRLREEIGFSAVFVTHDVPEAMVLADRIAVMRAGRIVQCDTPQVLLERPADDEVAELLEAGGVRA